MTGLVNMFAEKLGNEVEPTDEKFVNSIKLKLPDKFITVHHDVRKDNKGRDQVHIIKFERFGKGKPAPTQLKGKSESDGVSGSDW